MLLEPKIDDAICRIMAVFDEFHPSDQVFLIRALMDEPTFAAALDKMKRREALAEITREAQRLKLK